jgi:hypothetical protein
VAQLAVIALVFGPMLAWLVLGLEFAWRREQPASWREFLL